MSTPSIIVGRGNWGVKTGNLLGYSLVDSLYLPREFTCSRANNTATRVNRSGNIEGVNANTPRIDYFGGQASLLVEPSAQNQSLYSEQFDDPFNGKFNLNAFGSGSVANTTATLDPYGTNVADYIQENSAAGVVHAIINIFGGNVSGTTYTWSVFAKAAERTIINLFNNAGGGGNANFDLTTGVVTLNSGVSASMQNYGNGWWRCILTYTSSLSGNHNVQIRLCDDSGNPSYNGTGNQGAYIFGAQLETGSVATSYIPTTTGPVTRNADAISLTGATNLIGQTEGTLYAEVDVRNFASNARIIALSDGTGANAINLQLLPTNIRVTVNVSSIGQVDIIRPMSAGVNKIAVGYAQNNVALYLNGTKMDENTSCNIPATNKVDLGSLNGSTILNDRIRTAEVYPTRLPNVAPPGVLSLQSLTTL